MEVGDQLSVYSRMQVTLSFPVGVQTQGTQYSLVAYAINAIGAGPHSNWDFPFLYPFP